MTRAKVTKDLKSRKSSTPKGSRARSGSAIPEVAFYYPGIIWNSGNWIKNLLLFFDGIALLIPDYMVNREEIIDPTIAIPLKQRGLLRILKPEKIVDASATQKLSEAMVNLIDSGVLDPLSKEKTRFHELSYSRLGGFGDESLAQAIFEKLKAKGLARKSQDKVSIPMHPMVRALILVLLAQILRPQGKKLGIELSPATDNPRLVYALEELLSLPTQPSTGHIVSSDLEAVGVDLELVPIGEVLAFREEYGSQHRRYARAVREFVFELGLMKESDRARALESRLEEIRDYANDLKKLSRKAWKKPASFALGIVGAAWTLHTGDPIPGLIGLFTALLADRSQDVRMDAYSYIFSARDAHWF
jgi:hypothetical protein